MRKLFFAAILAMSFVLTMSISVGADVIGGGCCH
jgi:hypothetical protein